MGSLEKLDYKVTAAIFIICSIYGAAVNATLLTSCLIFSCCCKGGKYVKKRNDGGQRPGGNTRRSDDGSDNGREDGNNIEEDVMKQYQDDGSSVTQNYDDVDRGELHPRDRRKGEKIQTSEIEDKNESCWPCMRSKPETPTYSSGVTSGKERKFLCCGSNDEDDVKSQQPEVKPFKRTDLECIDLCCGLLKKQPESDLLNETAEMETAKTTDRYCCCFNFGTPGYYMY